MPVMDGLECARNIRNFQRTVQLQESAIQCEASTHLQNRCWSILNEHQLRLHSEMLVAADYGSHNPPDPLARSILV